MSTNIQLPDFISLSLTVEEKKDFIINTIKKHRCSSESYTYCKEKICNKIHLCSYSQRFECKRLIYLEICPYGDKCNRCDRDSCNYFHSYQINKWYELYTKTTNEKLMCNTIINYLNDCFDNMAAYKRRKNVEYLRQREEEAYRRKKQENEFRKKQDNEFRMKQEDEFRKKQENEFRKKQEDEFRMKQEEELYRKQYHETEFLKKQQEEKELYIEFQKIEEMRRFELFKKERALQKMTPTNPLGFPMPALHLPQLPPPPTPFSQTQTQLFIEKRGLKRGRSPPRRY